MHKFSMPIRIVLYREEGRWVAHCLEFDLVGDGESVDAALKSLLDATAIQVQASADFNNWINLFRPADAAIFQLFAAGKNVASGEFHLESDCLSIPGLETREVEDDRLMCV